MTAPTFFTDRDLGKQFPAILETAGFFVERHAAHFSHDTPDDQWLSVVAARGWIILTHDQRIRYKVNERDAVMANGAGLIVLVGKAPFPDLARSFVASRHAVSRFLSRTPLPFIAKVHQPRPADRKKDPAASGTIELWLSASEWRRKRRSSR